MLALAVAVAILIVIIYYMYYIQTSKQEFKGMWEIIGGGVDSVPEYDFVAKRSPTGIVTLTFKESKTFNVANNYPILRKLQLLPPIYRPDHDIIVRYLEGISRNTKDEIKVRITADGTIMIDPTYGQGGFVGNSCMYKEFTVQYKQD